MPPQSGFIGANSLSCPTAILRFELRHKHRGHSGQGLKSRPDASHLLRIADYCDTGAAKGRSPFRFVITSARFLGARDLLSWLRKGKQIPRFARDDNSGVRNYIVQSSVEARFFAVCRSEEHTSELQSLRHLV